MSHWKDILCFVAILAAWGLAGHFDYEDAIGMDTAAHIESTQACSALDTSFPGCVVALPASTGFDDGPAPSRTRTCVPGNR